MLGTKSAEHSMHFSNPDELSKRRPACSLSLPSCVLARLFKSSLPGVVQVMKMLMPLLTPAAGKINFQLPEGAVLSAGDLLAVLDLEDPGAVTAAAPYLGGFPELGPPLVHSQGVDYRFKEAYSAAKMILEGKRSLLPLSADRSSHGQHLGCLCADRICCSLKLTWWYNCLIASCPGVHSLLC